MNYEKAFEVNKELKLTVDEQQDDIKDLKEQNYIQNKDEVKEITAAINPMKKGHSVLHAINPLQQKMG